MKGIHLRTRDKEWENILILMIFIIFFIEVYNLVFLGGYYDGEWYEVYLY
jgi:hypothetical protein